jgi:endoglucanase
VTAPSSPRLRRGVNLGGWLAQCEPDPDRFDTFVTVRDVERLHAWGFDHVRIPLDERLLGRAGDASVGSRAIAALQRVLAAAAAHSLACVLDLHETSWHTFRGASQQVWSDPEVVVEALVGFWSDLVVRLPSVDGLVLDLLNEPNTRDPEPWAGIVERVVAELRRRAPDAWLLVEAVGKADPGFVPSLPSPVLDRCLYGFHFYEPMGFTHQSAWWSRFGDLFPAPQEYPGRLRPSGPVPPDVRADVEGRWDRGRLAQVIAAVAAWAERQAVPLHCGEFGAYRVAPAASRRRWILDVAETLEDHGIGWCLWAYREMGYGLVSEVGGREEVDQPLLAGLTGRPQPSFGAGKW